VIASITHNFVKKEEVKNLRKMFKYIDKDSDGRISKDDLIQAFKENFGTVIGDMELDQIMKSIDHDNNGYIEYEEFLRATLDKTLLLSETNLQHAFNMFDLDKNGSISADEIKSVIGGGRSIPDNVVVELLAEIDKTQDDEITYDEFRAIMNKITKK